MSFVFRFCYVVQLTEFGVYIFKILDRRHFSCACVFGTVRRECIGALARALFKFKLLIMWVKFKVLIHSVLVMLSFLFQSFLIDLFFSEKLNSLSFLARFGLPRARNRYFSSSSSFASSASAEVFIRRQRILNKY